MHIMFVIRFAAMGRKQTNFHIQNPTSTSIRYEDLQWANTTRQSFAHSTSVLFFFFVGTCFGFHRRATFGESTEKYNQTLRRQFWVKLIFDVFKLIHSCQIRIMNMHMGQKIIDMI